MPIVFAASIGNIVQGTIYYIQFSEGNGGNRIRISTTLSGPAFTVGTATATVRANLFNMTSAPSYYKIQQPAILSGINVTLATPANSPAQGTAITVQISVYRTPDNTNPQTSILPIIDFFVTFNDSTTVTQSYYNSSKTFGAGDKIHTYLSYYGGVPTVKDLTVQLDMF
jgi:hypothetical protein